MNGRQKIVIAAAGALMLVMLLFPPFVLIHEKGILNCGYAFLLSPPSMFATVNVKLLILQWIVLIANAAIAWYLFKEKRQ
jgi:hypothetical protein